MDLQKDFADDVEIPVGGIVLHGELIIPDGAKGVVIFAHGSGSSRFSPRNKFVAGVIREGNLGTLLFDLLTANEEQIDSHTRHFRFDIEMLAKRLVAVTEWLLKNSKNQFSIGFFGSSTGGGAALVAASILRKGISAVVSRGGRPDLAGDALAKVDSSVLLIVGELDDVVIKLNEEAYEKLQCEKELIIIDGATHLFEELGTLETVAELAADWFLEHLENKTNAFAKSN